ncbi:MAG: hypothetical protein AAGC60_05485 [Acidobacteriota bacterium]
MTTTGFQFFEGSSTESAKQPRITVRKGGILVLSQATFGLLGDDAEAVQVGYNSETRAIALRKTEPSAKGAYRLRSQRNSVSRLVDGKRVFRHHGLTAEAAATYDAEEFGDGLVGFTLPETAVPEAKSAVADTETKANDKPAVKRRSTKATKSKS